jgi:hypothetical protein
MSIADYVSPGASASCALKDRDVSSHRGGDPIAPVWQRTDALSPGTTGSGGAERPSNCCIALSKQASRAPQPARLGVVHCASEPRRRRDRRLAANAKERRVQPEPVRGLFVGGRASDVMAC